MEKIIVWGTGKTANKLFPVINDEIVLVVDNDKRKWGTVWNGFTVKSPSVIVDIKGNFDRIVIASIYWKEIRRQIIEEYGIDSRLIDNIYYRQKQSLLNHYKKNKECDKEKYILFLEQHPMDVFNDSFVHKYENLDMEVYFDSGKGLYYVYHKNKKMYFSARFSKKEDVKSYYSFLLMEQDKDSPHRYQTDRFCVRPHDIVLDAGVAEGNFALEIIDLVDKLYLIECDKEWIRALKCTFEPYKDKVEIIEGMLGNGLEESKTIDEIIGNGRIDFIKMDIEGAEYDALCGGRQSLERNDVKLAVCAYHHVDDQKKIEEFLEKAGYKTAVSDGYMIFITEQFLDKEIYSPQLVRGLVRGKEGDEDMWNVMIWGAGKNCEIILKALRMDQCNLIGIVDSNEKLHHSLYRNRWLIVSPEVLMNSQIDYVVVSVRENSEILLQCEMMGIPKDKVVDYWRTDKTYDFIDENVKKVIFMERDLLRCRRQLKNMPYELGMKPTPLIRPAEELLEIILKAGRSLSRFGDGELEIMQGRVRPWFQMPDQKLTERLKEVFHSKDERIIIALADNFGNLDRYTEEAADGIREYLENGIREDLMSVIDVKRTYYDAYVTRPYMMYREKKHAVHIFELFKRIWEKRNILIVEGKNAFTGVRNDLFEGAASIRRILAPPKDAFLSYEQILDKVKKHVFDDTLVLISLGPTATVLAYDLARGGIQALDIGQLDNEYDWYFRGVSERVSIPGKCVAEISGGHEMPVIEDKEYRKQIIDKVEVV